MPVPAHPGAGADPGKATGGSILVIAYHLLSDPDARFADLGPDWHDRIAPLRRKRQLIAELERLSGMKVTLQRQPPDTYPPHPAPLTLRRVLPPAH